MKNSLLLLSTALMFSSTSIAFAASSTDLTVKGKLTPSACKPKFPSGGVVELGKVLATVLRPDYPTVIGNSSLQLTITCEASTLLALQGIDNVGNPATAPSSDYGLGLVGDKKLGAYTLGLSTATDEGASLTVLVSKDRGLTWDELLSDTIWGNSDLASFGNLTSGSWAPAPVKNVTAVLQVHTTIAPTGDMDLTNDIPIDGSATLEVKYL